jgi:hypothetical protein
MIAAMDSNVHVVQWDAPKKRTDPDSELKLPGSIASYVSEFCFKTFQHGSLYADCRASSAIELPLAIASSIASLASPISSARVSSYRHYHLYAKTLR